MMPERNEDTGRYVGEFLQDDFLDAIHEHDRPVGTGEIADAVGCAHDTAYKRLKHLEEVGLVSSQKVGNTLVWTIVEDPFTA